MMNCKWHSRRLDIPNLTIRSKIYIGNWKEVKDYSKIQIQPDKNWRKQLQTIKIIGNIWTIWFCWMLLLMYKNISVCKQKSKTLRIYYITRTVNMKSFKEMSKLRNSLWTTNSRVQYAYRKKISKWKPECRL